MNLNENKLQQNKSKIKFSSSDALAVCTSAFTGTGRESDWKDVVLVVATIVGRLPLPGTLGVTLVPSVTWFIPAAIILNEGKIFSIIFFIKLTISVNIQENLDLFLRVVQNVRPTEHCVQHAQVGRVWREVGGVCNVPNRIIKIRILIRIVT